MPYVNRERRNVVSPKEGWRAAGACHKATERRATLAAAWIVDVDGEVSEEARRICVEECIVRNQCLFAALADPHATGIYAGYRFINGSVTPGDNKKLNADYGIRGRSAHQKKKQEAV